MLRDVVLKDARRLGVVAIEPVEDVGDVCGPVGACVEGDAHCESLGLEVEECEVDRRMRGRRGRKGIWCSAYVF